MTFKKRLSEIEIELEGLQNAWEKASDQNNHIACAGLAKKIKDLQETRASIQYMAKFAEN